MTAEAGGRDILLAYQAVGPNCRRVAELVKKYPDLKLATIVDNPGSLAELSKAVDDAGVSIYVYIDLDVGMHRTGIAPSDDAFSLYCSFADFPAFLPGGIHAYDGHSASVELCGTVRTVPNPRSSRCGRCEIDWKTRDMLFRRS